MSSKFNMKSSAKLKQIVLKEKPIPNALENYTYSTLVPDKNQLLKEKYDRK